MRDVGGVVATCVVGLALAVMARSLRDQQAEIVGELRQILQVLERIPGSDRVSLEQLRGDAIGAAAAPLTMVEYTDLQCPYCRQFQITVFPEIKRDYIDTGKLRYFARDFPLQSSPLGVTAARTVRCARDQGLFWEMRAAILANNEALASGSFSTLAAGMRMDTAALHRCLSDTDTTDEQWRNDRLEGLAAGVFGTPTFLVGRSASGSFDGVRLSGMQPYATLKAKFDALLVDVSTATP